MLARLDPRHLDRVWFPLGGQAKAETRAEADRAGLRVAAGPRARRPASSAGATTATSCPATGSSPLTARSSTRTAPCSAATPASGASRPASGAASASPRDARLRAPLGTGARTRSSSARAALAEPTVAVDGRLYAPVERAEAKLRCRRPHSGPRSRRRTAGSSSTWRAARTASRRGRRPSSTRTTPWSAPGSFEQPERWTRSASRCPSSRASRRWLISSSPASGRGSSSPSTASKTSSSPSTACFTEAAAADVTIAMRLENGVARDRYGALPRRRSDVSSPTSARVSLGLRRILDTVMDGIETRDETAAPGSPSGNGSNADASTAKRPRAPSRVPRARQRGRA